MSSTATYKKKAGTTPPMRGVVFLFVAFVVLGAGTLIYMDRRTGPAHVQTVTPPVSVTGERLTKPVKPVSVKFSPKVTEKPMVLSVPFVAQAPFGNWADMRQEDGCEEASALMAMRWRAGKPLSANEGLREILAIAKYEEDTYGTYHDTSAQDTVDWIFSGYFKYSGARVRYTIQAEDIMKILDEGNLVLVPVDGQKLGNPNFVPPGPLEHMLVIKGYDWTTKEFITNDPGTRRGESYRYNMDTLMKSIRDYPTGKGEPLTGHEPSAMIVISKR